MGHASSCALTAPPGAVQPCLQPHLRMPISSPGVEKLLISPSGGSSLTNHASNAAQGGAMCKLQGLSVCRRPAHRALPLGGKLQLEALILVTQSARAQRCLTARLCQLVCQRLVSSPHVLLKQQLLAVAPFENAAALARAVQPAL